MKVEVLAPRSRMSDLRQQINAAVCQAPRDRLALAQVVGRGALRLKAGKNLNIVGILV